MADKASDFRASSMDLDEIYVPSDGEYESNVEEGTALCPESHDYCCEENGSASDLRLYEVSTMSASRDRNKRWFAIVLCMSVVWIVLTIGAVYSHITYSAHCEPTDLFGKFSLCVMTYLSTRYVVDTVLAAICWRQASGFLDDAIFYRRIMKTADQAGAIIGEAHAMTVEMGVRIRHTQAEKKAQHTALNTSVNDGEYGKDIMANIDVGHALEALTSTSNQRRCQTNIHCYSDRSRHSNNMGVTLRRLIISMDAIPLITTLFWTIVASDALPTLTKYVNTDNGGEIPEICVQVYNFNWSLLAITFFHSLVRLTPIAISIWAVSRLHHRKRSEKRS